MNISDSSYNISSRNVNITPSAGGNGTAAGTSVQSAGGEASANAQISQVAVGQLFHGRILDITNHDVQIALDNSRTLLAHMAESVNLNIGDSLTFMIKENDGANVVIRPFMESQSTMKDNAIFKALDMNNISTTEKNYQIAETLMRQGMPVDKASMQKIMQQTYRYPDASVDTLVSLNKLGIPVNEASIGQYNDYLANTHQLAGTVDTLTTGVLDFSAETLDSMMNTAATVEDVFAFQEALTGIFSDAPDFASISTDNFAGMLREAGQGEQAAQELPDAGQLPDGTKLPDKMQTLLDSLAEHGVPDQHIRQLASDSETPFQLLNNINRLLQNQGELGKEQLVRFFQSDGYKDFFREALKQKFSLDAEKMEEPKEIDALYKGMYDKANKLLNTFSDTGSKAGQQMQEAAKGMQERLDFIQNLNNMYAYAQIPVRLSEQNMNSELFVYMNKRSMKSAKEDVSALLHLDMEHLGPTDVHVSLSGNVVHTRFYVEDAASAKIIDDHMSMLEQAIHDNGYSLVNETITREPTLALSQNMVVHDMLGQDLERSVKRYSFDVRM